MQCKQSVHSKMSGDRESTYSFEEALEKLEKEKLEKEKMENKSKVLRVLKVLNKLKLPLLFLLILVSWISLRLELSALQSEVEAYQRKLKLPTFHSRAASAEDCQELQNHGFSTSGHFLIDPDGRYFGKPAFEVYCEFDKNLTIVSPTSAKLDYSRLTIGYDDQVVSLIEDSGTCYQYVTFDSEKCLNQFWWEDSRGVKHWFRDNGGMAVGYRPGVTSVFLPIKAIGPTSPLICKPNEGIVEGLICSGE